MSSYPAPIVVAGMHRSGTSLVASILAAAGVSMGDRSLASDAHNPRGYFEDLGFLELNRRMLSASTRPEDAGHPDWGWTESERLDRAGLQVYEDQARSLVAERAGAARPWGWKDPRTTLLLDFWHALLRDPIYVLVYRFPWEVADSIQRLGAEVFLRNPHYAYRIWAWYNRHLLDFFRRHRDRSVLVSTDAFLRRPQGLIELLEGRLGLRTSGVDLQCILDPDRFRRLAGDDPLISLVAATHPDCASLLGELDSAADLSGAALWHAAPLAGGSARPADGGEARLAVVIPCFDQGELLIEAVASVERCLQESYELIVVNDGSREPRTLEVLDALRRGGYRVLDQENAGLAGARNRGFEEARAPYVLPLDADNRLRPGFIEPALRILDSEPKVGVVYGNRRDFGMRSESVDVPPFDLGGMLASNPIDACALLRKEVWRACCGYDGGMPAPGWEDWDLWLGAVERGWSFRHLDIEAFDYRVRPGSMVSALAEEELRLPTLRYLVAKHRVLYREHLPELLLAAQRSSADLFREARLRERRDAEAIRLDAVVAELSGRLEESGDRARELAAERRGLATERHALLAERDALLADRERRQEERLAFVRELDFWRERLAAMERTRSWRLRQRLIAIKTALRGLRSGRGWR